MRFPSVLWVLGVAMALPSLALSALVAGKYSDGQLTAELAESADGFAGTISLGNQEFPASGRTNGHDLDGSFNAGGNSFPFAATLDGDTMVLTSGGKTYTLKRISPPANPLVGRSPANPVASGPAGDDPLAGYTVEVASDTGKSLLTQKPNATSVQAALEATFPDLARYFGARPAIGSAYQDVKDPKSGGATFSAKLNGQPVRGLISCRIHDQGGATVAVVYGRADAPKSDWDKLMNPRVPSASPHDTAAAAPASGDPGIPLRQYQFPDGTGSIGLAEGWATDAQSAISPVLITGPANQNIVLGNGRSIDMPDSLAVRNRKQMDAMMQNTEARSRQMGLKPPPSAPMPPMVVAPMLDPVEALKTLLPQFSKQSEFNHGPSSTLDRIISSEEVPSALQGGKGAVIVYEFTQTFNGKSTHYRRQMRLQTAPLATQAWFWFVTDAMAAPVATYDHDVPVMSAMIKSLKIDKEKAAQVAAARNDQMRQMTAEMARQSQEQLEANARQFQKDQDRRFAIGQAQHAAQMEGYARHNQQWANDELQKSRNNADFIETIKGTRTVYDTRTGASGTADLNYAGGVVDQLNRAALDPNRFIQIPLRDEMYPVPAGR